MHVAGRLQSEWEETACRKNNEKTPWLFILFYVGIGAWILYVGLGKTAYGPGTILAHALLFCSFVASLFN
jgi:hypothetical protein